MELIQIYFNNFNKITIITNLFAFFVVVIFNFSLQDPDPGGKVNADPYGSGSTALLLILRKEGLWPGRGSFLLGAAKRRAVVVGEGVVSSCGSTGGCSNSATERGSGNDAGEEEKSAGMTAGCPRDRRPGSVQGRRATGLGSELLLAGILYRQREGITSA